jgi:hypothetical protein
MHFEILVEDRSGKIALEHLLKSLVGVEHTYKIHAYKGIGHLPRNLKGVTDPSKRVLLDQLPRLLSGYGKTFASYPERYAAVVLVVVDLDKRQREQFLKELHNTLALCNPKPPAQFLLAIEEGEAWLLGDREALKAAYPQAKDAVLDSYKQDSICGTWQLLADAIHPGGSAALKEAGYPHIGEAKCRWADQIAPLIGVNRNQSPSFRKFRDSVRELCSSGS